MKKIKGTLILTSAILGFAVIFFSGCKKDSTTDSGPKAGPTVSDADGNVYHSVVIGSQTWMVENLKTTKYNDNAPIPGITSGSAWDTLSTPAYCWYNFDGATNKNTYGALYNWYAVHTGKLCPAGWHVPTDAEWNTLVTFLGDSLVAGGKLKETGTSHWVSPNTNASNSSGFTALPAGSIYTNGGFYLNGKYGWYWSSTESSATEAWHEYMIYNTGTIYKTAGSKIIGFSVRCIKD